MKIIFCPKFTEEFIYIEQDEPYLAIDLEKAKEHIENCELCSKSVADLVDSFTELISPGKMFKLLKTIRGK